jgi:hypothetical protein
VVCGGGGDDIVVLVTVVCEGAVAMLVARFVVVVGNGIVVMVAVVCEGAVAPVVVDPVGLHHPINFLHSFLLPFLGILPSFLDILPSLISFRRLLTPFLCPFLPVFLPCDNLAERIPREIVHEDHAGEALRFGEVLVAP